MAGPKEPEDRDSELDETGTDSGDDDGNGTDSDDDAPTDREAGSDAEGADDEDDGGEGEDDDATDELPDEDDEDDEDDVLLEDDLEDEFADFIDEELGYADVDWDTVPKKELDRHDELRLSDPDQLDGVERKGLTDLERWAAARAYLAHGDEAAFETMAKPLLATKKPSPALDYVDITLALMSRKARREDFQGAFDLLEALHKVSKDEDLVRRFRAILTLQRGDRQEGLEMLAQLAESKPDDPYFLLSLGEDLCGIGYWEEAVEYLEIAEELARERADQDLLASIENAVQFAQRQLEFDDVVED